MKDTNVPVEADFLKRLNVKWPEEVALMEDGYHWLGWQVHSGNNFTLSHCKKLGHKPNEVQHSQRGSDSTLWCDDCHIWWKIDSSD